MTLIHAYPHIQIKRGSASTLNQGIVKTMTRGVNIEKANFEGKDLTVGMEGGKEGGREGEGEERGHVVLQAVFLTFLTSPSDLFFIFVLSDFHHSSTYLSQGVSFQQSLMRAGNFRNSKCFSASFFDADLSSTFWFTLCVCMLVCLFA